jgi:thioredoxin-dependent peroxiredoxin
MTTIALSFDSVMSHVEWIKDIDATHKAHAGIPVLADGDRKFSKLYDLSHTNNNETSTVRSLLDIRERFEEECFVKHYLPCQHRVQIR